MANYQKKYLKYKKKYLAAKKKYSDKLLGGKEEDFSLSVKQRTKINKYLLTKKNQEDMDAVIIQFTALFKKYFENDKEMLKMDGAKMQLNDEDRVYLAQKILLHPSALKPEETQFLESFIDDKTTVENVLSGDASPKVYIDTVDTLIKNCPTLFETILIGLAGEPSLSEVVKRSLIITTNFDITKDVEN